MQEPNEIASWLRGLAAVAALICLALLSGKMSARENSSAPSHSPEALATAGPSEFQTDPLVGYRLHPRVERAIRLAQRWRKQNGDDDDKKKNTKRRRRPSLKKSVPKVQKFAPARRTPHVKKKKAAPKKKPPQKAVPAKRAPKVQPVIKKKKMRPPKKVTPVKEPKPKAPVKKVEPVKEKRPPQKPKTPIGPVKDNQPPKKPAPTPVTEPKPKGPIKDVKPVKETEPKPDEDKPKPRPVKETGPDPRPVKDRPKPEKVMGLCERFPYLGECKSSGRPARPPGAPALVPPPVVPDADDALSGGATIQVVEQCAVTYVLNEIGECACPEDTYEADGMCKPTWCGETWEYDPVTGVCGCPTTQSGALCLPNCPEGYHYKPGETECSIRCTGASISVGGQCVPVEQVSNDQAMDWCLEVVAEGFNPESPPPGYEGAASEEEACEIYLGNICGSAQGELPLCAEQECDESQELIAGVCCPQGQFVSEGACVASCPAYDAPYPEGNLKGLCDYRCPVGRFKRPNGNCTSDCGTGYAGVDGFCIATGCAEGELALAGGGCALSCPNGQYAYEGSCVANCPNNLLASSNGACTAQCLPGHDPVNGQCTSIPCPEGQVTKVFASGGHACFDKCAPGSDTPIKYNNHCIGDCPAGQVKSFAFIDDKKVWSCSDECSGVALQDGTCGTSCPEGQFSAQGACWHSCGEGHIPYYEGGCVAASDCLANANGFCLSPVAGELVSMPGEDIVAEGPPPDDAEEEDETPAAGEDEGEEDETPVADDEPAEDETPVADEEPAEDETPVAEGPDEGERPVADDRPGEEDPPRVPVVDEEPDAEPGEEPVYDGGGHVCKENPHHPVCENFYPPDPDPGEDVTPVEEPVYEDPQADDTTVVVVLPPEKPLYGHPPGAPPIELPAGAGAHPPVSTAGAPKEKASASPSPLAVVIANGDYAGDVPDAPHALANAAAFVRYLREDMALPVKRILAIPDKRLTDLEKMFGTSGAPDGELKKALEKSEAPELIVFFTGHAMSVDRGRDAVLLPADADPEKALKTGYRLSTLYENLADLGVERLRLYLDTSFGRKLDAQPVKGAPPAARVVTYPVIGPLGLLTPPQWVVLMAGTGAEPTFEDPDAPLSAFTAALISGLRGKADAFAADAGANADSEKATVIKFGKATADNAKDGKSSETPGNSKPVETHAQAPKSDGLITAGELVEFTRAEVGNALLEASGGSQTPALYGNEHEVLVQYPQ